MSDQAFALAPTRVSRRRRLTERVVEWLITAVGLSGIALVALIFVFVAKEALPLFFGADANAFETLGAMFLPQVVREGRPPVFSWQPVSSVPKLSMVPLFVGTLKTTAVAMFVAVPLGVGAALFASEFAPRRAREWLKPVVELLAAVPSVVLGFFALMVMADVVQSLFGFTFRLNAMVAGLGLSLAVVPVVFTVAEDALRSVPDGYRHASLALGATRWETAWKVVLPAASPGVVAACVLGFGRAIGETMIVLMASGNASIVSWNVGDSVRSLSATIAAELGEVVVGSPHYSLLFFIGVQLFVFTWLLNLLASASTRRLGRRVSGSAS